MSFIYSVSDEYNNSKIGKLATPLKVLIEAESDAQRKKGGALTTLFNIEKSNRYGETIQYGDEFTAFSAAAEGTAAEADSLSDTFQDVCHKVSTWAKKLEMVETGVDNHR